MPRVSVAHEQAVRQRIVDAAIKVFGELGYQRASIQDVVRESGLSVGAVYTYFKNKQELFVVACACQIDVEKADLRLRMADLGSVSDRLRVAVDFAVDSAVSGHADLGVRVHAWMAAEASPDLTQILYDQRQEMVGFSQLVVREAQVRGELPDWIDADTLGSTFVTLIDGFVVRAAAGGITADVARHEAYAMLELLLGACAEMPTAVARLRELSAARPAGGSSPAP
jgi:AcrR family transcriptional regulator